MEEQVEFAVEYRKKTVGNLEKAGFTPGVIEEALMEIVVVEWVDLCKAIDL